MDKSKLKYVFSVFYFNKGFGLNVFYFTKLKKDRKTSARLILIPLLLHKYTTEYNKDITIAPLLGLYRWLTQMHKVFTICTRRYTCHLGACLSNDTYSCQYDIPSVV